LGCSVLKVAKTKVSDKNHRPSVSYKLIFVTCCNQKYTLPDVSIKLTNLSGA